jgi:multidrug transporter EmrE-like cation transporter
MKILSQKSGLIASLVIFEIIAQYFLQRAIKVKKRWYKNHLLLLGMFAQILMTFLYFLILKSGYSLAIANTLIDGGGALGIVLLGYFVFNQKLTPMQLLAVIITMVGVLLLGIFDN